MLKIAQIYKNPVISERFFSFHGDPFAYNDMNSRIHLFTHDLLGINHWRSTDGINFEKLKRVAFFRYRSFLYKNILHFEKIYNLFNFPFYKSYVPQLSYLKNYLRYDNIGNPNLISYKNNTYIFVSCGLQKMDYGLTEPKFVFSGRIYEKPQKVEGIHNLTSLRPFYFKKAIYAFATVLSQVNSKSSAEILICRPKKFPTVWEKYDSFLSPGKFPWCRSHIYVSTLPVTLPDNKTAIYFNARDGWSIFSNEKIGLAYLE